MWFAQVDSCCAGAMSGHLASRPTSSCTSLVEGTFRLREFLGQTNLQLLLESLIEVGLPFKCLLDSLATYQSAEDPVKPEEECVISRAGKG